MDKALAEYASANATVAPWKPDQYYAALTNVRSVGVMGDERTYDYAVALRAVRTTDFMTADSAHVPYEVLDVVMNRIIKEVRGTQLQDDVVDAFLRLVDKGKFRAPDDFGGGTTEDINNIHKKQKEEEKKNDGK